MIKCNVTVCGTICRVATVRTNSENKVFTAFAVNCVVPAKKRHQQDLGNLRRQRW